ncbi:dihydroorotase [Maribacter litopenaei]|uniref:Dihydroorotase n=1 Tax=Maribacter litopenaei TaxID=2976127 RepID=A0ABY5YAV3_9FLAO|nr:dihydroorotase [Maribacter litopenaei]UWX56172.1 dihydroorotase [Maribacter litopenaei]
MNILLKSAKIVNGATKEIHLKKRDILIKNGIIEKISTSIDAPPKTKIIENKNLHVSLGWIDTGVSFGEPGYEERETIENGLRTSARSGFTDVILNPNSLPLPDSSSDIVFLKNAGKGEVTNLHPLGNLTVGGKGETLAELYDMRNAGAVGFYDFKQAVANANLLKIALQYAQNFNGMILSFPLDHQIAGKGIVNEGVTSTKLGLKGIPSMAEELQVSRDLFILEYTGGKLHIPTVSTADSVKLIAAAKKKGLNVTCSVAIHNIFKTDEVLEDFETNFKVLPPLRTSKDAKELIKGVKNGIIDFVTSDHTPLNIELKKVEFDHAEYGTIGLESSFGALNQLFSTEETIDMLTRGRKTFGIEVPEMKEGVKANLTFFDPTVEYTFTEAHITSSSKNSLFLNHMLKGKVLGTIANDQVYLND